MSAVVLFKAAGEQRLNRAGRSGIQTQHRINISYRIKYRGMCQQPVGATWGNPCVIIQRLRCTKAQRPIESNPSAAPIL